MSWRRTILLDGVGISGRSHARAVDMYMLQYTKDIQLNRSQ